MHLRSLRITTRLAITHGLLVLSLVITLGVTLQGLVRMLGLITEVREEGFEHADIEEALHRSAWNVEVALRRGRTACAEKTNENAVGDSITRARAELARTMATSQSAPVRLRNAVDRYLALADDAIVGDTCEFLGLPTTDKARTSLDEELTNAWIERMHELHANIEGKEDSARRIGNVAALAGVGITALCVIITVIVARNAARNLSAPIGRLASHAMRLGEGDFTPIPRIEGAREIEELWRDLERARERLAELDSLKQGFLASVSHELRSPLGRIREALALLGDGTCGPLNETQARVTSLAARACDREVRIVDALLDMSRLQSGLPLKREAGCDIDRVLDAAVMDESPEARERGIAIDIDAAGKAPSLEVDSALVERAIANLLRNAVSVSRAGDKVVLRRTVVEQAKDQRIVRIEVSDQGPGIAEEFKASLFRPFSAAHVSKDRPPGIGLGLAFARDVARAHGGELIVDRSDGAGTTFRFDLPAAAETT